MSSLVVTYRCFLGHGSTFMDFAAGSYRECFAKMTVVVDRPAEKDATKELVCPRCGRPLTFSVRSLLQDRRDARTMRVVGGFLVVAGLTFGVVNMMEKGLDLNVGVCLAAAGGGILTMLYPHRFAGGSPLVSIQKDTDARSVGTTAEELYGLLGRNPEPEEVRVFGEAGQLPPKPRPQHDIVSILPYVP